MVIQVHRLQLSAGKIDDGAELGWAGRSRVGVGLGRGQIDADGGWHACDCGGYRSRGLCLDCRHAVLWFHVRLGLRLAVVGALSPLQLLRCAGQAQMPLVQQRGGGCALDARGIGASIFVGLSCCIGGSEPQRPLTIGVLAGAVAFHLVSLATGVLAALATGYPLPFTA